jgi:hypothetical protein
MTAVQNVRMENQSQEEMLSAIEANTMVIKTTSQSVGNHTGIIPLCDEILAMIARIRGRAHQEAPQEEKKAVTDDQVMLYFQQLEKELLELKKLYSDHKGRYQALIRYSDIESKAFEKISECFTELDKVMAEGANAAEKMNPAANDARGVKFRNRLVKAYEAISKQLKTDLKGDEDAYGSTIASLRNAFKDMQAEKQKVAQITNNLSNLMTFLATQHPEHAQSFQQMSQRFGSLLTDITKLEQQAMNLEQSEKLFSQVRQKIRQDIRNIIRGGENRLTQQQVEQFAKKFTRAQYEQEWKKRIEQIKKDIEGYFTGLRNKADPNRRMNELYMRQHFHDAINLLEEITHKIDEVLGFVQANLHPRASVPVK